MNKSRLLSVLCLFALGGCAVGPDYVRPDVAPAASFKEAAGWKQATPTDQVPRGTWWQVFGDSELNRLEQQLNLSNQNIALAAAQYRQASALLDEAQAGFLPTVGLNAGETHARSDRNTVSTAYSAALSASWEIDLWGQLRRSAEAGEAKAAASAANLENARLSAQAQLAIAYFQLLITDRQKQSLDASVAAYQQQLTINQNRFNAGVAGRADVVQASTQLHAMQVQATDKGLQRAKLEHAIAVLIGQSPSAFALRTSGALPSVPHIPLALPSQLLERRPDIAAAERLMAQANAEIGVATAAYFPQLTLSASGGYRGSSFADWVSLPNRVWSVGPALAATLFDGGLRRAQTKAAQASYDQSVATYRQTVLTAFQDVEDNLVASRLLQQEAADQHQALEAARESAAITNNQYKAGMVSFLDVTLANATREASERAEFDILNSQLTAAVGLIKALGGGYGE
jgi:NodT family efflux transporter outer membrane factor (OMF) lipoprotein